MESDPQQQKSISGVPAKLTNHNLGKFVNKIDYHLLLSLFTHAEEVGVYSQQSLSTQKLKILKQTFLLDKINEAESSTLAEDKKNFEEKLSQLKEKSAKPLENLNDASDENIAIVLKFSKYLYENGQYKESEEILLQLIKIVKNIQLLNATWGLFNIYILTNSTEKAFQTFHELRSIIKSDQIYENEKIIHVNMLINTALFLFKTGQSAEFLFKTLDSYKDTLAAGSIHLLRYYIITALLTANFDALNESILPLIQSDSYRYRDAFTIFIESLLEEFNYETALSYVADLEAVSEKDYFLSGLKEEIGDAARNLILSVFGMIHQEKDINAMVEKLGKARNDAEKFKLKPLEYDENNEIEERLENLRNKCEEFKNSHA